MAAVASTDKRRAKLTHLAQKHLDAGKSLPDGRGTVSLVNQASSSPRV